MDRTIAFANVHVTLDNGETFQVMYLHRHYAFVDVDGVSSFIPLSAEHEEELVEDDMNLVYFLKSDDPAIEIMDMMIGDLNHEEELKKLKGGG
jgi:hypothetical protein